MGLTNPGVIRISGSDSSFSGTVRITGGPNITVGTDASGISISGAAGGGGNFSGGVSNLGNTAGSTGVSGTRMVLVGTNNISLSQSTDANGNTISISGAAGGGGAFSAGVSNLGNTAGSTGVSGSRLVLVGSQNVSLSQSTDANGATVSFSAPAGGGGAALTLSRFPDALGVRELVAGQQGNATLHLQPFDLDNAVQFDRLAFPLLFSGATNSTNSHTITISAGIYTRNVSSLSLLTSASQTVAITHSGTANSSINVAGIRLFTVPLTSTLTGGGYWLGVHSRTTTGGGNATWSQYLLSQPNSNFSGFFGVANNASNQFQLGLGTFSVTFSTAMPGSIAFSQLTGTGSLVLRRPAFMLLSGTV